MAAFGVPLIWLVVAVALLALELAQPSFDGLMFAALQRSWCPYSPPWALYPR